MRTISLCAGIGGIELGLSLVLPVEPVLFVERDAYCQSILRARWPGVPIDCDVCQPRAVEADLLTAGFPCQPWSDAGARKGTEDERWLWPAIVEWIRLVGPRYVFLENVPGLLTRGGAGYVLGDLAALRFDAEWGLFSCEDLEASNRRQRLFILAYANGSQREESRARDLGLREQPAPAGCGGEVGDPDRPGHVPHQRLERRQPEHAAPSPDGPLADSESLRRQDGEASRERPGGHSGGGHVVSDSGIVKRGGKSESPRVSLSTEPPEPMRLWAPGPGADWTAIPERLWPAVEPSLCGVAPGLSDRAQRSTRRARLRALGNSVSPPVAAAAWCVLAGRLSLPLH